MTKARRSATGWGMIAALLTQMLSASCAPPKHKLELSAGFKKTVEEIGKGAGQSIEEGMAKQTIPPGSEPPQLGGSTAVAPGEPIWIQSGKSRTLMLRDNISRVS